MSYHVPGSPPDPAAPRQRPAVVSVSSLLLWLTAALLAFAAIVDLTLLGTFREVFEQAYAGTEAEGNEGFAVGQVIVIAAVYLVFAVAFALLAIFNNLGKNASRITTWVFSGVAVCCTGGLFALGALTSGMEIEGAPDLDEIQELLAEQLPGWYEPATLVTTFGSLAALIAAAILLMLPKANEFFRKPTEEDLFEPPEYPSPPGATPSGGPPGPS